MFFSFHSMQLILNWLCIQTFGIQLQHLNETNNMHSVTFYFYSVFMHSVQVFVDYLKHDLKIKTSFKYIVYIVYIIKHSKVRKHNADSVAHWPSTVYYIYMMEDECSS